MLTLAVMLAGVCTANAAATGDNPKNALQAPVSGWVQNHLQYPAFLTDSPFPALAYVKFRVNEDGFLEVLGVASSSNRLTAYVRNRMNGTPAGFVGWETGETYMIRINFLSPS